MSDDSDLVIKETCKVQWKTEYKTNKHGVDAPNPAVKKIRPHVYLPPKVWKFLELKEEDSLTFWSLKNKNDVLIQKTTNKESFTTDDSTTEKVFLIGSKAVEYRNRLSEICHKLCNAKYKLSKEEEVECKQLNGQLIKIDHELEKVVEKFFRGKVEPKEILELKLNEDVEDFSKIIVLDVEKLINDIVRHRKILQGLERAKNEKIIEENEYLIFHKTFLEQLEFLESSLTQIKKLVSNLD